MLDTLPVKPLLRHQGLALVLAADGVVVRHPSRIHGSLGTCPSPRPYSQQRQPSEKEADANQRR